MRMTSAALVLGVSLVLPAIGHAESVQANGTINSVDTNALNITHAPIPEIGWPAMTMDIVVLDGADVSGVAAGDEVSFTLEKGPDGLYGIRGIEPRQ